MTALTLDLPYPPSVNHYWRHTRRGVHYISDEGKKYRDKVFLTCMGYLPFKKPVSISVEVYFPDKRKRDLDNLGKVLLDSLVQAKIIEDDCWQSVPELKWKAMGVEKCGRIVVRFEELEQ
ncbi:RusA family crossover junction endodeoxyribonuclease [Rodentibacter genomosp. 2]|uniref:Crossover junction endodeoxyribonuclease rusA n=1 Tax=Rodentibacter genomosp. 2 TaxID=1908266 RepID=A0A1V3JB46_9PAST|nr:RusA family crossover junction endodeoxyribonuclease [Rodentibacter genomosp. 2]OOF53856.1 hypothetical protein BKK55_10670 [Rodentibacter genomosp. 2]